MKRIAIALIFTVAIVGLSLPSRVKAIDTNRVTYTNFTGGTYAAERYTGSIKTANYVNKTVQLYGMSHTGAYTNISGTVKIYGSQDGSRWTQLGKTDGTGTAVSFTSNGSYVWKDGFQYIRFGFDRSGTAAPYGKLFIGLSQFNE